MCGRSRRRFLAGKFVRVIVPTEQVGLSPNIRVFERRLEQRNARVCLQPAFAGF
jgi:hypothetical protein